MCIAGRRKGSEWESLCFEIIEKDSPEIFCLDWLIRSCESLFQVHYASLGVSCVFGGPLWRCHILWVPGQLGVSHPLDAQTTQQSQERTDIWMLGGQDLFRRWAGTHTSPAVVHTDTQLFDKECQQGRAGPRVGEEGRTLVLAACSSAHPGLTRAAAGFFT